MPPRQLIEVELPGIEPALEDALKWEYVRRRQKTWENAAVVDGANSRPPTTRVLDTHNRIPRIRTAARRPPSSEDFMPALRTEADGGELAVAAALPIGGHRRSVF